MSQLLAVLPSYLPSSFPGNVNKTSRRNLFTKNKLNSCCSESNAKRVRTNSEGDCHKVKVDTVSCTDVNENTQKGKAFCFVLFCFVLCVDTTEKCMKYL